MAGPRSQSREAAELGFDLGKAQLHPAQERGTNPTSWPRVTPEWSGVLAGLTLASLSEDKLLLVELGSTSHRPSSAP